MLTTIINQAIGRNRDRRGRFVKGNAYRIAARWGNVWMPNGWASNGRSYNAAMIAYPLRRSF